MSETKHTVGPWHWDDDGNLLDQNGDYILQADAQEPTCFGAIIAAKPEDRALISAAPELLKEMKRFLSVIEYVEKSYVSVWSAATKGSGIATANAYRAAIAKAEGREAASEGGSITSELFT
jgi:hypothetical protein